MKRNKIRFQICPNCGTPLQSTQNFCASCGQENHDINIPLKHLFGELLENIIHFDAKSIKTIKELILKPGHLTNEFTTGKRKSYVPPLRLYIFVSFIFFLILNLSWQEYNTSEGENRKNKLKLSFTFFNLNSNELIDLPESQIDSLMETHHIEHNSYNLYAVKQLHRITNGSSQGIFHLMVRNFSYSMFILMPLFAFILKLFYKKQNVYYLGYLVHSLHIHSFGFIALSLYLLLSKLISSIFLPLIIISVLIFYFYLSEKKVFKQSRGRIIFKSIIIIVMYIFFILATLIGASWAIVLLF
jgi:hypothetical protein